MISLDGSLFLITFVILSIMILQLGGFSAEEFRIIPNRPRCYKINNDNICHKIKESKCDSNWKVKTEKKLKLLEKLTEIQQCNDATKQKHKKNLVNCEFIEIQYHKDYYDVITAINNITTHRELFNPGMSITSESKIKNTTTYSLANTFISQLNSELHKEILRQIMNPVCKQKYGSEEQLEELGIPPSLYNDPASVSIIKLIRINNAKQCTTEDQVRFIIEIIVQKYNANDQMVMILHLLRNNKKSAKDIIVEQIFIKGYLTNNGLPSTISDKFHNYGSAINDKCGITNQNEILKIMKQKHKEREYELNHFLCNVDTETKEFHGIK